MTDRDATEFAGELEEAYTHILNGVAFIARSRKPSNKMLATKARAIAQLLGAVLNDCLDREDIDYASASRFNEQGSPVTRAGSSMAEQAPYKD